MLVERRVSAGIVLLGAAKMVLPNARAPRMIDERMLAVFVFVFVFVIGVEWEWGWSIVYEYG